MNRQTAISEADRAASVRGNPGSTHKSKGDISGVNASALENYEATFVCLGCRYPRQRQADIIVGGDVVRHPYTGERPGWSGYCTDSGCNCPRCRPENQKREEES